MAKNDPQVKPWLSTCVWLEQGHNHVYAVRYQMDKVNIHLRGNFVNPSMFYLHYDDSLCCLWYHRSQPVRFEMAIGKLKT